jgi:3-oxoacyl-(acyl-carrier-protein) synthase
VVVIGAEAPLTAFTIAQMKALKIYSKYPFNDSPCRPFECISEHKNSLVLGEACGTFLIESEESISETKNIPIAELSGIGFSQELSSTLTGMNDEGIGYQTSMKQALYEAKIQRPDFIVAHGAGTIIGDSAEKKSLETLFNNEVPPVFSTKHLTGHTFGASAAISLLFALEAFQQQTLPKSPFGVFMNESYKNYFALAHTSISSCIINASGFGGVSLSAVLRSPHS